MEYDFNILYYINMYKKWWKRIALVVVVSMSITMFFLRFQSTTYVSTVTLLSTGGGGASSGPLGTLLGLSGSSSTDVIVPLLNSRRMARDISDHFALDKKPGFRYSISTGKMEGAFAINVNGTDPVFTMEIANFVVENLDKINKELDVTSSKPMVKVLDPAVRGAPILREKTRKIFVAGILSFLLLSLYVFFSDYLRKLKAQ